MSQIHRHIHINGIVQGVGFRPFIFNLAQKYHLRGWVRNSASGVDIETSGEIEDQKSFLEDIANSAPALAQIDSIDAQEIKDQEFKVFEILRSEDKATDFIPVSPDVAICDQCREELFTPTDHRYRYPFINCTNCGPRFSIIMDIPYDRPKTTMASFAMCEDCQEEYENPIDRRFHAQPVACPVCGPQIWLENNSGEKISEKENALQEARRLLASGKILSIKGLGGFHLACDATNHKAVTRLRQRKQRPAKPFALMAFNLETIEKFTYVSPEAGALLRSPQAPIVLLPKREEHQLPEAVAPGQANLGFMLPYTPLHLLLLEPHDGYPEVLVMTSGNLVEEPILHHNQDARIKLGGVADAFLLHNRPIHRRIDDSVFSVIKGNPYPIRRARGYAPNPIRVNENLPQVLAVGPQMKNTFCLTRDKYAFLSHHIGEMDNWETYQDYQKAVQQYESLFRIQPQAIAYDLHPDYITTQYARERANADNLPSYPIQHHHAHLAASMIENGLDPDKKVAGLIFDGTGFGTDGTIWGGEILMGDCYEFTRIAHLKPVPLPGGDVTIRKPARMALSMLWAYGLPWDESILPILSLSSLERSALKMQLEKNLNTTMTSSMGRLFDAVSALIGVRNTISYEAQAAIELEAMADPDELGYYPWHMEKDCIDVKTILECILADLKQAERPEIISTRFHNTISRMALEIAQSIRETFGINQFVLSGGVWQNQRLLEKTITMMEKNDLEPLIHHQMPPNDGCVAFGQAMVAAYRYLQDKE